MANSYTDENGVYRNKPGFTNADQLSKYEYEVVAARSREILAGKIDLGIKEHSLKRLSAIHEHLFKDVYDWAGKLRTVPSSKRADSGTVSRFAEAEKIVENWQELEKRATGFVSAAVSSLGQRSASLAEFLIEANRIHAFPEGNGRSLQVFMKELAKDQYVELDYTKITPDAWNRASAISGMHGRFLSTSTSFSHRQTQSRCDKFLPSWPATHELARLRLYPRSKRAQSSQSCARHMPAYA